LVFYTTIFHTASFIPAPLSISAPTIHDHRIKNNRLKNRNAPLSVCLRQYYQEGESRGNYVADRTLRSICPRPQCGHIDLLITGAGFNATPGFIDERSEIATMLARA
jgi:hypothetical protein